jgi:alpha-L-fucosidase 2
MDRAVSLGYQRLKKEHIQDYTSLFNRVNLDFGGRAPDITTEELLKNYITANTGSEARYLEELYFQYGRYLLISSSREGTLPANLQGVWNATNTPAWCCDYHINVNL